MRILKPGGQLIFTTRYYDKQIGYSSMYWYADSVIVPKSVKNMECYVPSDPIKELYDNGFINIDYKISKDLIYNKDFYKNSQLFKEDSWRSADSFWSHIERNNEIENLLEFLQNKKEQNILEKYIEDRDKLRNNKGHIIVISCNKL